MKPTVLRETGEPFGSADVRYSCSCGYATDAFPELESGMAERAMREHLADDHGPELGVGRCANCRRPTDHLRAESQLGTAWLCENCAPSDQLRQVIG